MKTKEEIEQLARDEANDNKHSYIKLDYQDGIYYGFIKGYTQCQVDMTKELYEFGKLVLDTFHSEGRTHSGKERLPRIKFDEWFNGLNKQD